jgi:RimJ/RimL family protein N-acetyltransferase
MKGWNIMTADLSDLSENGLAWTFDDRGVILGIAGLLPQWENRAIAWAVVSESAGSRFIKIHAAVCRFLQTSDFKRIEANIDIGFEAGERWMRMLGFEYEGYLKAFRPDGQDMLMYARIK